MEAENRQLPMVSAMLERPTMMSVLCGRP